MQLLLASESRELAIIDIARPDAMGKDTRGRSYQGLEAIESRDRLYWP